MRYLSLLVMAASLVAVEVETRLDAVLVFPDRAEITRLAEVTLEPGRNRVTLLGLPVGLVEDSLRCEITGEGGARVVDFQSGRYRSQRNLRQELAELDVAHESLQAEVRVQEDAVVALRRRGRLLTDYRKQVLARIRADLRSESPPLDQWKEAMGFLAVQARDGQAAIRTAEVRLFELQKQIADNRQRVDLLRAGDDRPEARRLQVLIETPAAGGQQLRCRYLVRAGVAWGMHYDLRLDRERQQIEVNALVAVSQDSDEDWRGAKLSFSTRRPARGLRPPGLDGLRLVARDAMDDWQDESAVVESIERAPGDRGATAATRTIELGVDGDVERPAALKGRGSLVQPGGLEIRPFGNLTDELLYTAVEPVAVPADGRPVLVPLGTWSGPAQWRLECLPEVLDAVHVRCDFVNPTGARLLPGPAQAYLDGRSIGRIEFPGTAVGGRATCAFGISEDLVVHRQAKPVEQVEVSEDDERVLHKWRYVIAIEVRNIGSSARAVWLHEVLPVSELAHVKVTLDAPTTRPAKTHADRLDWRLQVEPGQTVPVTLAYTIAMGEQAP